MKIYMLSILSLIILSCAPSYRYVGMWDQQRGTHTYINLEHGIELTFPSERWIVYPKPNNPFLKSLWIKPVPGEPYHILFAAKNEVEIMQLMIAPKSTIMNLSLEGFLELQKATMDIMFGLKEEMNYKYIEHKIIKRDDREIAIFKMAAIGQQFLFATFDGNERLVIIVFNVVEALFADREDEFWSIVDSYTHR